MRQVNALHQAPYVAAPILIITAHILTVVFWVKGVPLGVVGWGVIAVWYLVRMTATTLIYHRLLAHRSYTAPRWFRRLGTLVGCTAAQMGPLWWVAKHRHHHNHTDEREDHHSPTQLRGIQGFLWAQGGWLLSRHLFLFPSDKMPSDLEADPFMVWADRYHWVPVLIAAGGSYAIGGDRLLFAFCLSTVLLFHAVQTVNSVAHLWGSQPFETTDTSRQNVGVAILTLGEGWHNAHHAFPFSARHGLTVAKGTIQPLPDPTFWMIRGLEKIGIARDVKQINSSMVLEKAT